MWIPINRGKLSNPILNISKTEMGSCGMAKKFLLKYKQKARMPKKLFIFGNAIDHKNPANFLPIERLCSSPKK